MYSVIARLPFDGDGHYNIPTSGCPVKVPPHRIPVCYREEVHRQLKDMLE